MTDVVLSDLLAPNLCIVFCGTALGAASAQRRLYYAGPGNRFWSILAETNLTPARLTPERYRDLLHPGIGLTDVVKNQSGADSGLTFDTNAARALEAKIRDFQPAVLCFNGKRAAQEYLRMPSVRYGRHHATIGRTVLFMAPSTSGAAVRWWDPAVWHELANLVRNLRPD
jgi:TDG/mug DNA glycosylase family protein